LIPFLLWTALLPLLKPSCSSEPQWPAGLPHGEEVLPNIPGAWFDFSQGKLIYGDEGKKQGDIYLEKTFIAGNPALHVALHDDLADSILYKTTAPSLNWTEQPNADNPARVSIYDGHCIWIKTGEGNYAKIKILLTESNANVSSYNWVKIQWMYEPDGSQQFHGVPSTAPAASN
jgi:hypothetical protein